MSIKEKYFPKEGYTAFRLWAFAAAMDELSKNAKAMDELSKNANKSKAASLRDQVIEFSESAWMSAKGTKEEKDDLQELIDNLTVMAIN